MKKLITLLAIIATITSFAQAPQGFNYQATVRNNTGALIVNQNVLVKFNVYQNTATGTLVYSENQTATTDDLGHIALVVGQGTATTGTFSTINWGSGSYFLGIELNTGSGYLDMGTTQLMSVPYAFYSSNGTPGPQGPQGLQGIQGIAGPVGATGVQGIPGNDGATGPQGVTGPQGLAGTNGTNGADGLSAYQLWINAGNTGTESQFLASLQGPTGAQGIQGATGATGATGPQGPVGSSAFPIGSVIAYMGNGSIVAGMEANGWFKCDGRNISSLSALSADEITTLTNILGGSSNLPDLRGNFLRGLDEGRGQDLDAGSRTGGESTTGVRSYQENQIKSHSHTGSTNTDGAHVHGISGSTRDDNNFAGGQPAGDAFFGNLGMATNFDGSHSHNLTTNNTGGAETRPVNIAVYWLIRGK